MEKQSVLALDIGTNAIKTFLADIQPRSLHIQSHGQVDSVKLAKGELPNPKLLSDKLRQAVNCTLPDDKKPADCIIVGVSGIDLGTQVSTGTITIKHGCITAADLQYAQRAAEFTAALPDTAALLHTTLLNYRIDGQAVQGSLLGRKATTLECQLVLWIASQELINIIKEALALAELKPDYFVANIFALSKTTRLKEKAYLLLDIGAGSLDFAICDHAEVLMAGVLPLGGNIITSAVEQECELDFLHADKLKCYFSKLAADLKGQGIMLDCSYEADKEKNIAFDFLSDIIHNRVSAISELVGKVLIEEINNERIASAYMVGGCAKMTAFSNELTDKLGICVKSLDLQKVPSDYRCPENAAGYGLLQYVQLCFAEQQVVQELPVKDETGAAESFVSKIRNMLHL